MQTLAEVTVIVPTTASKEKFSLLIRAIESIRHSSSRRIEIITVVNGDRADPEVCQWLQSQADIQYERVIPPSAPLAVFHGRALVQTAYFSMLDDDDEYLPGGTDLKRAAFSHRSDADIVITSGLRCIDALDRDAMVDIERVPDAPLVSLFQSAWLASCNALFRSTSFPASFFADPHPYAEWTWLAFKLALAGQNIVAINQPTFRINDTPDSLSKSSSYHDAYQALYQRMLAMTPPPSIAKIIHTRIGSDWHDQSVRALQRGAIRDSFIFHLRSLTLPGGLRYLTYTRHLVRIRPNS